MIALNQALSGKGSQTFALIHSDAINAVILAAATAKSITIPTGSKFVILNALDSYGASVGIYLNVGSTAEIPAGDVTDGSASEINPGVRYIAGATTVSVISPVACYVSAAFYN